MKNGYPQLFELNKIKNWSINDFMELIDFIRDRWTYNSFIKCNWEKHRISGYFLRFELVTGGMSGNERLVESLLKNEMFKLLWYAEWRRGGKYVFEINPEHAGYLLVSKYCKENKISRQAIYQNKHKYSFIEASSHIVFVRRLN